MVEFGIHNGSSLLQCSCAWRVLRAVGSLFSSPRHGVSTFKLQRLEDGRRRRGADRRGRREGGSEGGREAIRTAERRPELSWI